MAKRTTVFDLWSQKGKKKWPQTHIDTAKEAEAAYKAGIEIISCEPDHHFKDVRKVAPTAFLSVGLKSILSFEAISLRSKVSLPDP